MPAPCQPQNMNVSLQVETCQPQEIIVSLMSASKLKHVNPRRWLLAPRLKHVSLKTRMSASTDVSDWNNGQPHRMIVSLQLSQICQPHKENVSLHRCLRLEWSASQLVQIEAVILMKIVSLQLVQIECVSFRKCQPPVGPRLEGVSLIKKMSASSWSRLKCISLNLNQC